MITIYANPTSGNGLGAKNLLYTEEYLKTKNVPFVSYTSTCEGEPTILAAKHCKESSKIIIIGGDGTLNEVVNGLDNIENYNICFLPSGTGNDFAFSLQIESLEGLLDNFLNDNSIKADYLKMNDSLCLNVCGTGLDTEVLQRYNAYKKKTKFTYIKALIKTLFHFRWYKLKITVDEDQTIEGDFLLVACCNGKRIGASIMVSPASDISDGLIDLILIKRISRFKVPFVLLQFIKGHHLGASYCKHIRCRQVCVENESGNMTINIDGNLVNANKMETKIESKKLTTYTSK